MLTKPSPKVLMTMAAVVGTLGATSTPAQDTGTAMIVAKLESHYKLAKMGADFSITDAGTVMVVQKDGLLGVPPAGLIICPATFKDGVLHGPGGFAKVMCGNDARAINTGTKVYILKIAADAKKDKVTLLLVECDSCNGAAQASSYKTTLVFQFPQGYLNGAAPDQIEDVINQVVMADTPPAPQEETTAPAQAPAGPSFTNEDVIKLAQEKLPDAVILAKIKASACQFDTSADALVNLKRAGVSDAVLQAMVEAPSATVTEQPAATAPGEAPSNAPASAAPCNAYDTCMKMAQTAFDGSQWARALAAYQAASQLDTTKAEAFTGCGNAYFQMAQYDDASSMWDKALQLGATLSIDVCHAGAMCGDKGHLSLSIKEIAFVNRKGEKEFAAAPSAVTSEGAVLFRGSKPAYYVQIRFEKNWRFYYQPRNMTCGLNYYCQEPGATQQKIMGDYVHGALVRMAAGELVYSATKP